MIKIVGLILELATGRNPKCCQILNLGLPYSGAYMHILEDANYAVTGECRAYVESIISRTSRFEACSRHALCVSFMRLPGSNGLMVRA
ncbi:hypothetical protein M3J09_013354 [Ascochyta lentis]